MSACTILTLANGKGMDLTAPLVSDIDFAVLAEHLAKENRYNGATPGQVYTVAQHCVIAADAAHRDTDNRELAAYVLLHDGHEAFLKDDTTPKKRALAEVAAGSFGLLASEILGTFDLLTYRMDVVIHEAAGLPWPMTSAMRAAVKAYDEVLFVTEWRDLMRSVAHPNWDQYHTITPLPDTIVPFHWTQAKAMFIDRCRRYLPCFDNSKREAAE